MVDQKNKGLKPVFDLEDAANITPIGDALSARDVYNAVTEKKIGLELVLAALGILPFIPSGLQKKPRKKQLSKIPTVNKNTQSLLDAKILSIRKNQIRLSLIMLMNSIVLLRG